MIVANIASKAPLKGALVDLFILKSTKKFLFKYLMLYLGINTFHKVNHKNS